MDVTRTPSTFRDFDAIYISRILLAGRAAVLGSKIAFVAAFLGRQLTYTYEIVTLDPATVWGWHCGKSFPLETRRITARRRALDPHTEADPAALLLQFLIAFGNVIGRFPYFSVGADRHFPNEFGVLVGASSKGRKGSSLSTIEHVLGIADTEWLNACVQTGLPSGEGLIWAVRGEIDGTEPIRAGKEKCVTEYRTVIKDHGVSHIPPIG